MRLAKGSSVAKSAEHDPSRNQTNFASDTRRVYERPSGEKEPVSIGAEVIRWREAKAQHHHPKELALEQEFNARGDHRRAERIVNGEACLFDLIERDSVVQTFGFRPRPAAAFGLRPPWPSPICFAKAERAAEYWGLTIG